VAERFQHARRELVLGVRGSGVAHHALLFGELLVEQKRVFPMKLGVCGHGVSPFLNP